MTTPNLDIDALERLARAATPGPWEHYRNKLRPNFGGMINEVQPSTARSREAIVQWSGFDNGHRSEKKHAANAAFIAAANPQTMLALCAALRAERAKVAEARRILEPFAHAADRLETQSVVSLRNGAPITIHNPNCTALPPMDFSKFMATRTFLNKTGDA